MTLQAITQKKDGTNSSKGKPDKVVDNIHVSPIAGLVATLFYLVAVIGTIVLEGAKAGDVIIALWVIGFTLIACFFLFAMKVAQQ